RIVVSRARQALLLILLALCRIAARKHHNMVFSLAHADGQKHQILFVATLERRSTCTFFTEREHARKKSISPT
ncbi:MAG: hypothetical protein IJY37_00210, partial [Clostridia bacterium]|nr:hypothetical protein [Clostridia bacterium]